MSNEIWKRIFEIIPDTKLIQLVSTQKISIPGIGINPNKKVMKKGTVRKLAITSMLKNQNLFKIAQYFNSGKDPEVNNFLEWREKEITEIKQYLIEGGNRDSIPQMLIALACSPVEELQLKAEKLFNSLFQNEEIKQLEQDEKLEQEINEKETPVEQELSLEDLKTQIGILENKNKESEVIIEELTKQVNQIRNEREHEKNQWRNRKEDYKKQVRDLRNTIGKKDETINSLTADLQEMKDLLKDKEVENQTTPDQSTKTEASYDQLQNELTKANEIIQTLQRGNKMFLDQNIYVEAGVTHEKINESHQNDLTRKKVILVGNPRNAKIVNTDKYEIEIVESNDFLEVIVPNNIFTNVEEVWMLTYDVSTPRQIQIRQSVTSVPLIEFQNFVELKRHYNNL